jgi:hypothetical protein
MCTYNNKVHNECVGGVTPGCDLGINRELIVPPICVKRLSKEPPANDLTKTFEIVYFQLEKYLYSYRSMYLLLVLLY